MKPFLYQVAEATYAQYGQDISSQVFVFPNRRAGVFFQKYLADLVGKPVFSPKITTINELFRSFTDFRVLDRTNLLFKLYKHYHQISANDESFDDFVFWGEMILNDFDDVDKYVVDAKQLFTNIRDLKEIESEFAGLTEEQIAAVREFWFNFQPHKQGKTKDEFLATWKILYPLYTSFRNELIEKGEVYEGMIFRQVATKIKSKESLVLEKGKYIFVGLNALSRSEEILLEYLRDQQAAVFYWDIVSPKTTDPDNRASFFINRYAKIYPQSVDLESDEVYSEPAIDVIGVSSAIGQAKQVHTIIRNLLQRNEVNRSEREINTAIVLPDEQLLMPTLYSIPEEISTINVTMGYPLSASPIAGLMEHIFQMQTQIREVHQEPAFYFRFLLPVLNHRYIENIDSQTTIAIHQQILQKNKIYIALSEFSSSRYLSLIFRRLSDTESVGNYLLELLDLIRKGIENESPDDPELTSNSLLQLEKEYIYQYYIAVSRMNDVVKESGMQLSIETYLRLLRKMVAGVSIPFEGEPLSGLQIMGVLETRALDFENLIILSMNEGIFPLRGATNSFIPYNLRRGFGISTYEHQDSVYAYHFYRMIHRAKNIYLLYDTRSDGMQTGEVSRYVLQMKYHYRMKMVEKLLTHEVSVQKNNPITVAKSPRILEQLAQFHEGGNRELSATSINTYLDCPLKFYLREIEKMTEEEAVTEELEASQFGTIFHHTIEQLYAPYLGEIVSDELLKKLQLNDAGIWHEIQKSFTDVVFFSDSRQKISGHNLLIANIIKNYIKQVFKTDSEIAPFVYRHSEVRVDGLLPIGNGVKIKLKGTIDRVDEIKGQTRIIDYKTGNGELKFNSIEELFDSEKKKRPKAIMQVFLYSWLYSMQHQVNHILPGIYYLRQVYGDFQYKLEDKGSNSTVESFDGYRTDFEAGLSDTVAKIFNPELDFVQTTVAENCTYCEFKELCRKD